MISSSRASVLYQFLLVLSAEEELELDASISAARWLLPACSAGRKDIGVSDEESRVGSWGLGRDEGAHLR